MSDDTKDLAREVLAMFELQADYFKSKNGESLTRCKAVESALKKRCKAILDDAKPVANLFDGG